MCHRLKSGCTTASFVQEALIWRAAHARCEASFWYAPCASRGGRRGCRAFAWTRSKLKLDILTWQSAGIRAHRVLPISALWRGSNCCYQYHEWLLLVVCNASLLGVRTICLQDLPSIPEIDLLLPAAKTIVDSRYSRICIDSSLMNISHVIMSCVASAVELELRRRCIPVAGGVPGCSTSICKLESFGRRQWPQRSDRLAGLWS